MVSHHLGMFGGFLSSAKGDMKYLMCHMTSENNAIEKSKLYEWELFMICHHLAKFGGGRYCSNRDIMFLVCHVVKEDHVIKGSGDYKKRSPSRQVNIVPSLVIINTVVVEI